MGLFSPIKRIGVDVELVAGIKDIGTATTAHTFTIDASTNSDFGILGVVLNKSAGGGPPPLIADGGALSVISGDTLSVMTDSEALQIYP